MKKISVLEARNDLKTLGYAVFGSSFFPENVCNEIFAAFQKEYGAKNECVNVSEANRFLTGDQKNIFEEFVSVLTEVMDNVLMEKQKLKWPASLLYEAEKNEKSPANVFHKDGRFGYLIVMTNLGGRGTLFKNKFGENEIRELKKGETMIMSGIGREGSCGIPATVHARPDEIPRLYMRFDLIPKDDNHSYSKVSENDNLPFDGLYES